MNPQVRFLAQQLLLNGLAPLSERDRRMLERIARRVQVAESANAFEQRLTFGQRMADRVAAVGGSWWFILISAGNPVLQGREEGVAGI